MDSKSVPRWLVHRFSAHHTLVTSPCLFLDQHNRPFSGPSLLSSLCLLLVRSVVPESQWVLAVLSVLGANQWELTCSLPFRPVFCTLQNFSTPISLLITCFYAGFLFGLSFSPEDGRDMFLRNVG
jgi:hypothetical protein